MSKTASIALSGMQAAQASLGTAAHNIANASTTGFRRQAIQSSTEAGGGVRTSLTQAQEVGPALVDDLVNQLQAKNAFLANLAVFKTQDQMTGSLLNTLG